MQNREKLRTGLRIAAGVFFIGAGVNHFVKPAMYQKIVPPGFGSPAVIVAISGIAEIAGGMGLLIRPLRRPAGWGLIALLIAVFPANIHMLYAHDKIKEWNVPLWLLWARLPLQAVLIAWVWFVSHRCLPPRTRVRFRFQS